MAVALWGRESDLAYLATKARSGNMSSVSVDLSPMFRKSYKIWRRIIARSKELED